MKKQLTTAVTGAAMLLSAGVATAQQTPPRGPNDITGSDTFDGIMLLLFETYGVTGDPNGIGNTMDNYLGIGSSGGERQMEGAAELDEQECGSDQNSPGHDPTHPGCQEIAPMSRMMDSSICNDPESDEAEGIAVCGDALAVFTDNTSMRGDSASACADWEANDYALSDNTGPNDFVENVGELGTDGFALPNGYVLGANPDVPAWQDVLRIIYTGCLQDQGDCVGGENGEQVVDRQVRCGDPDLDGVANPDTVRAQLVADWNAIVDGVDCAGTNCPDGLKRAYRRDDNSGTTGVYLGFLDVANDNLASRQNLTADSFACTLDPDLCCEGTGVPIVPIPEDHSFCDGGQNENFAPDCHNLNGSPVVLTHGGDPIRTECADDDDLCGSDGAAGLVQAMVSTPAEPDAFAEAQCRAFSFELRPLFLNPVSGLNVCPDGRLPQGGTLCNLGRHEDAQGNILTRNCMMGEASAAPGAAPIPDGRSYNMVQLRADGTIPRQGNGFVTPSWRVNSYVADNSTFGVPPLPFVEGFDITEAEEVCVEGSATRQIGCLVANTTCAIGFAGREAVFAPDEPTQSAGNEPFKIAGLKPRNDRPAYALTRDLFVNAIGGFHDVNADCDGATGRGEDGLWCDDQFALANQFYLDTDGDGDGTGDTSQACAGAGFIPYAEPTSDPTEAGTRRCVGAAGNAGCGETEVQNYTDCLPQ